MSVHDILVSIRSFREKQYYDKDLKISLDLAYITDNLIVCSGPVDDFLHKRYRNNLDQIIDFLNANHGSNNWKFFNLRAEKLGYTLADENRIEYLPFLDHEAPPFYLIHEIVTKITDYLNSDTSKVAVIHCKAGKGRSGTIACCYLMFKNPELIPKTADEIFASKRFKYVNNPLSVDALSSSCQFKFQNFTIVNPINEFTSIKIKNYADNNRELKLVYEFVHDDIILNSKSTIVYGFKDQDAFVLSKPDVRVSFHNNLIGRSSSSFLKIPMSSAHFWFNGIFDLFGSEMLLSNSDSLVDNNSQASLTPPQSMDTQDLQIITRESHKILKWDELDGFKGTYNRGIKLFDSIEVHYSISFNSDLVADCYSNTPQDKRLSNSRIRKLFKMR
ncbi:hypothetical protein PACTADRAFT_14296 [Pachysolen tannophilus NRRL Y-2460]|uniref:phosphatidylinositol-3,4,5-trisphosphate 3-phosphatase n=2 Tax=Pachysolen tannophilus NRRL Y-2460 TaxID=669874 RepID=A0A1E4U1A4_PACTA|nr:hypothetical protein PACTADRAFT_14296 [Pachysolen tannophilus NRRL Y-2460]